MSGGPSEPWPFPGLPPAWAVKQNKARDFRYLRRRCIYEAPQSLFHGRRPPLRKMCWPSSSCEIESSISGRRGIIFRCVGQYAFSQYIQPYCAVHGSRINNVHPGFCDFARESAFSRSCRPVDRYRIRFSEIRYLFCTLIHEHSSGEAQYSAEEIPAE